MADCSQIVKVEREIHNEIYAYSKENPYDFDNNIVLHYYPQRIISLLNKSQPFSLLDLGLGHGYSVSEFAGHTKDYTILEGDPAIIEHFNATHSQSSVNIVNTFFEDYAPCRTFDVIVAGFVLEHVDDPLFILKKYRDFLSDDGRFFIAVPNAESLNRRIGYAAGLLPDILQLSDTDLSLGHKRYFTHNTIRALCEEAGLHVNHEEGIFLKPFTTRQILSLNLDASIIDAFCTVGEGYPELAVGILLECKKEPNLGG